MSRHRLRGFSSLILTLALIAGAPRGPRLRGGQEGGEAAL